MATQERIEAVLIRRLALLRPPGFTGASETDWTAEDEVRAIASALGVKLPPDGTTNN